MFIVGPLFLHNEGRPLISQVIKTIRTYKATTYRFTRQREVYVLYEGFLLAIETQCSFGSARGLFEFTGALSNKTLSEKANFYLKILAADIFKTGLNIFGEYKHRQKKNCVKYCIFCKTAFIIYLGSSGQTSTNLTSYQIPSHQENSPSEPLVTS